MDLQKLFLYFAAAFVLMLVSIVAYRSSSRSTVIGAASIGGGGTSEGVADLAGQNQSKLQLHDFHRVEVKDGRPVWEVKASNATYYPKEALTYVNDARMTVYRADGQKVTLGSKVARLYMNGESVQRAELEGDIKLEVHNMMEVNAEFADYDIASGMINALGPVDIKGAGFLVKGAGMEVNLNEQNVRILENVTSRFEAEASLPKGIDLP